MALNPRAILSTLAYGVSSTINDEKDLLNLMQIIFKNKRNPGPSIIIDKSHTDL